MTDDTARKLDKAADRERKPDATETVDELEETIDDEAEEAEQPTNEPEA